MKLTPSMKASFPYIQKGGKIIDRAVELLTFSFLAYLCLSLSIVMYSSGSLQIIPMESHWQSFLNNFNGHSFPYSWLLTGNKVGPHKLFYPLLTCSERNMSLDLLCQLQVSSRCRTYQPAEVIADLWAIAPVYAIDQSRAVNLYRLHDGFRSYIESIGLSFCTIEGIRKDLNQSYLMTHSGREPFDIQVQIYDDNYIRENLLNVALKKIPHWEYAAWIDAHQVFDNQYWWEETIVKLEKDCTIQLFKKLARYTLHNQSFDYKDGSFSLSLYQTDLDFYHTLKGGMPEYGGALAIRKEVYNKIGSILDTCIATGCDMSFIKASIPKTHSFVALQNLAPYYAANFDEWVNHARSLINESRATIRGTLHHLEHEHNIDFKILPKSYQLAGFDIRRDLARDENGTLVIINPTIKAILQNPDPKVH